MDDLALAKPRLALLLGHLSELQDARQYWRVAYPLREVLFLVVCATIANCDAKASTPPRAKSLRPRRTVSSRTLKACAMRWLVQPVSVSSIARARSASPRSRECANARNAPRCSSLASTGDLAAMPRRRKSLRRRNHTFDSLVKPIGSA